MLLKTVIFHRGGVVLWSGSASSSVQTVNEQKAKLIQELLNGLIHEKLLQQRESEQIHQKDDLVVRWQTENDRDLVVVGVYSRQGLSELQHAESFLETVRKRFVRKFCSESAVDPFDSFDDFTPLFQKLYAKLSEDMSKVTEKKPRSFQQTSKGKGIEENDKKKTKKKKKKRGGKSGQDEESNDENGPLEADNDGDDTQKPLSISDRIKAMRGRGGGGARRGGRRGGKGRVGSSSSSSSRSTAGSKKGGRKWEDDDDDIQLNYADDEDAIGSSGSAAGGTTIDLDNWAGVAGMSQDDFDDDDEEEDTSKTKSSGGGFFSKYFSVLSNRELTEESLNPVLEQFREHLVAKNVASEIATQMCDSVRSSMVGQTVASFTTINTTVRNAMRDALVRILTPARPVDVLRDALKAKEQKRPYVVVFVGVNGVGKSTNLAKVCFWLMQNKLSVMIAACDTFRSGAVEQLRVHGRALGVDIFQRGYGKDASNIAAAAIKKAKDDGTDVVLIDTAGRMQDNEPLMRSLSKLVNNNSPDLVLFVGEALVGNDAVDQLSKFNAALRDLAPPGVSPRMIDGIILTKFDTIDDKVGAALSMVYTTGQPVVFIGTGQTYTDLKKMNVDVVTRALLK